MTSTIAIETQTIAPSTATETTQTTQTKEASPASDIAATDSPIRKSRRPRGKPGSRKDSSAADDADRKGTSADLEQSRKNKK